MELPSPSVVGVWGLGGCALPLPVPLELPSTPVVGGWGLGGCVLPLPVPLELPSPSVVGGWGLGVCVLFVHCAYNLTVSPAFVAKLLTFAPAV